MFNFFCKISQHPKINPGSAPDSPNNKLFKNKCLSSSTFPEALKINDIGPICKKQDVDNKTNYRPIGLLPIISEIFGKVFYEQLETVAYEIFSPKLCGFRKGHSSQNAFLNLLKNW